MTRKPIAKIFKKWVFQVVKEIRLTGEFKLNKTIQDLNDEIIQKDDKYNKSSIVRVNSSILIIYHTY